MIQLPSEAISEAHLERRIAALERVYRRTAAELTRRINSTTSTNYSKWRATQLLAQVDAAITVLNAAAVEFSENGIPEGYRRGIDVAGAQMAATGLDPDSLNMGNRVNTAAVQVLADQMALDALKANGTIKATAEGYLRLTQQQAVSEAALNDSVAAGLVQGSTRREVSTDLEQALVKAVGEGKLIQAGTRFFDPAAYARLLARTRTREAVTQGTVNSAMEAGMTLVQVSVHTHPQEDPCTPFQGKVFSLDGNDPVFPRLMKMPPFHPNCKHVLLPVTAEHLKELGQYEALAELAGQPEKHILNTDEYDEILEKARLAP